MGTLFENSQEPRAFLSYSHADDRDQYISDLRKALEIEVQIQTGQRFTIFQDADIQAGQDFEQVIQLSIEDVLLFIPVISPSYFNSDYCRSELKAFLKRESSLGRRDLVIPIYYVDYDIFNNDELLRKDEYALEAAVKRHHYSDWRTLRAKPLSDAAFRPTVIHLANSIKEAVKRSPPPSARAQEDIDPSVDEIRTVLDEIRTRVQATRFRRRFRSGITLRVLTAARDEIQRLTSSAGSYKQDLSLEENFIVRAGPIFEEASQVYAISIDQYSEFWVAEDQRTRAQEYTARQPENAVRLFVFSSMEIAQKYRYVLAAHYARYGKQGAVLLTSMTSYRHFLASIDLGKLPELSHKDFAILIFRDRKIAAESSTGDDREYFEATLSQSQLVCEQLTNLESYHLAFIERFEDLRDNLPEGQTKHGVLKWQEEFKFDNALWSAGLSKAFGIANEADSINRKPVYHIVFLAASASTEAVVRHVEENVRLSLEQIVGKTTGERLVDEFWFGQRNQILEGLEVDDGKYGGRIKTSSFLAKDFPFCLVLRLRSIDDLKEYYEHPVHSEVRRELLCFSDPRLIELYNLLENPEKLTAEERKVLYGAIETTASTILLRADFSLESPFKGILEIAPVDFHLPRSISKSARA